MSTIFAALFRRSPDVEYTRELLSAASPDHPGVVALDWPAGNSACPATAPVCVLLPGLTGGSEDSYVRLMVQALLRAGVRCAVFNSRGCAGSPVITPQFYSASFTSDCREVMAHVRGRHPGVPLVGVGWSLGV